VEGVIGVRCKRERLQVPLLHLHSTTAGVWQQQQPAQAAVTEESLRDEGQNRRYAPSGRATASPREPPHMSRISITWECHSSDIDGKPWQQQCCLVLCLMCAGGPQTPCSLINLLTFESQTFDPCSLPVYSAPPAAPYTGQLQVSLQHQPAMTILPHSTHSCSYMLRVQLL